MVQIIALAIKKFDEAFQIAILSVIKYRFEKERENRVQGIEACCKKYPFPSARMKSFRFFISISRVDDLHETWIQFPTRITFSTSFPMF